MLNYIRGFWMLLSVGLMATLTVIVSVGWGIWTYRFWMWFPLDTRLCAAGISIIAVASIALVVVACVVIGLIKAIICG